MKYLITLLLCVNVAFAQCPPGTWGLDVIINPDQYPEDTTFTFLSTDGDTLM